MSNPVQETIVCSCGKVIRNGYNITLLGVCKECKRKLKGLSNEETLNRELRVIMGPAS